MRYGRRDATAPGYSAEPAVGPHSRVSGLGHLGHARPARVDLDRNDAVWEEYQRDRRYGLADQVRGESDAADRAGRILAAGHGHVLACRLAASGDERPGALRAGAAGGTVLWGGPLPDHLPAGRGGGQYRQLRPQPA